MTIEVKPLDIEKFWLLNYEHLKIEIWPSGGEMAARWKIRYACSDHEFRWIAPNTAALRRIRSIESEAKKIAASSKARPAAARQGVRL